MCHVNKIESLNFLNDSSIFFLKHPEKVMKKIIPILFILVTLSATSQSIDSGKNKNATMSLAEFVETVKEKNQSIKNAKSINVMVNDLLIEDLNDFKINPKTISRLEVLVLEPNGVKPEETKPSIIITTKTK